MQGQENGNSLKRSVIPEPCKMRYRSRKTIGNGLAKYQAALLTETHLKIVTTISRSNRYERLFWDLRVSSTLLRCTQTEGSLQGEDTQSLPRSYRNVRFFHQVMTVIPALNSGVETLYLALRIRQYRHEYPDEKDC